MGVPFGVVVAAHHFEAAFDGFGAGIAEKRPVREAQSGQFFGQPLGGGNAEQVGSVPERAGLGRQRLDQARMAMAEAVDGDSLGEIEIFPAGFAPDV